MKNDFGIIIQKTRGDGLDFNLFPNNENLELNVKYDSLSEDERDTPKLGKDKDVFVVQFSENYKIYSLIIGLEDRQRAGFYGIRIFVPKGNNLQNFTSILYKIQSKFLLNPNSSSSDNLIYDDILETIKNSCSEVNKFIVPNTRNNNHFCYYESNNSIAIEAIFNSNKTYLISKLYAFQKPKEEELRTEISINNIIYKEIDLKNEIVEIKIKGDLNYLKELKINNTSVNFNKNQNNLFILKNKKDKIEYILKENAQKNEDASTNEIIISRKNSNGGKSNGGRKEPPKSFIDKYGTWLILILLATMIILIIQQEYFKNPDPEMEIEKPEEQIPQQKKDTITKEINPIDGETLKGNSKGAKTGSKNSKRAKTESSNSKATTTKNLGKEVTGAKDTETEGKTTQVETQKGLQKTTTEEEGL